MNFSSSPHLLAPPDPAAQDWFMAPQRLRELDATDTSVAAGPFRARAHAHRRAHHHPYHPNPNTNPNPNSHSNHSSAAAVRHAGISYEPPPLPPLPSLERAVSHEETSMGHTLSSYGSPYFEGPEFIQDPEYQVAQVSYGAPSVAFDIANVDVAGSAPLPVYSSSPAFASYQYPYPFSLDPHSQQRHELIALYPPFELSSYHQDASSSAIGQPPEPDFGSSLAVAIGPPFQPLRASPPPLPSPPQQQQQHCDPEPSSLECDDVDAEEDSVHSTSVQGDLIDEMNVSPRIARLQASLLASRHTSPPSANSPTFPCIICSKRYTTKWFALQHRREVHEGGKPFSCASCKERFTEPRHRDRHASLHPCLTEHSRFCATPEGIEFLRQERVFICYACDKIFKDGKTGNVHVRKCHAGTTLHDFPCYGPCGQFYVSKAAVRAHWALAPECGRTSFESLSSGGGNKSLDQARGTEGD